MDGTGLNFYNARYYDSAIGRFVSADSIVPQPGGTQGFNRYAYAMGNPMKFTDPTGHDPCSGKPDVYVPDCGVDGYYGESNTNPPPETETTPTSGDTQVPDAGVQDPKTDSVGPIREWLDEHLAPDRRLQPDVPDPHVKLSNTEAEANAWFVLGWDVGTASLTTGGYMFIGLGAATLDPAATAFGYLLTNVASTAATVTLLDTALTSGPDSNAYRMNALTYTAGWTSLIANVPLDLGAAWLQVAYDAYTIDYMYRHPTP
ncbi:MAG: RHS repeat-associated core domain-containing protein [Chloroflexi bacterium]|nr:RHS repeat-associated core domain-containing protein [Chloroflexota bacterium]